MQPDKDLFLALGRAKDQGDWDLASQICADLEARAVGRDSKKFVQLVRELVDHRAADLLDGLIETETVVRYEYTVPGMIEEAEREGRQDIVENLRQEAEILAAIENRTGVEYQRLQGIPIDDAGVCAAVLPILADWLVRQPRPPTRCVIYELFWRAKDPEPFSRLLLDQLPLEASSGLEADFLLLAVSLTCRDEDVARAWAAIQEKERQGNWFRAAAKLANRKTAPPETAAELRALLDSGDLPFYAVDDLSKVKDRRIRDWFRSQLDSSDRDLARVARRVAGKPAKPPGGVVYPAIPPVALNELDSTEVDFEELPGYFRELGTQWGLKLPSWLSRPRGLEFLDLDTYARVDVPSMAAGPCWIWVRLEDYDTVEVRLVRAERSA